ncbi:MAG: hypothetical protein JWN22_3616 [Nocardioides sp.]|nr:hypothetical protein [Nocardioides sp.]
MSDFEDRLRNALRAADAPDATGLADAARRRARTRRRTTVAATAIAVLAAVVAVPVTLSALDGDASTQRMPSAADPTRADPTQADPTPVTPGLRVETWHQATILVPDDWSYGSMTSWCASGGDTSPVVERPGTIVELILCTQPGSSYGVAFSAARHDSYTAPARQTGGHEVPQDAWVGEQAVGGVLVHVVAPTRQVAQDVLDSMQVVGDSDPNGCSLVVDIPADQHDDVTVCRYDEDGLLVQSERLSPEDGRAAMAAIAAAPIRRDQDPCPATPDRFEQVLIGTGADLGTVRVIWGAHCLAGRGVFMSGVVRELTSDVMYWALSPGWSGGVDGDVPLPGVLRR